MYEEEEAVNTMRPWGSNPVGRFAETWKAQKSYFDDYLSDMEFPYAIDEVALLFSNPFAQRDFVFDAVSEPDVELFNVAYDRVRTGPFNTNYEVTYAFLRSPDLGMRVECMAINHGFSPLHEAVIQCNRMDDNLLPVAVHMSFKCDTADDYLRVCEAIKGDAVRQVQVCRSDYGLFSYFTADTFAGVYLKPRVNLRDSMTEEHRRDMQDDIGEATARLRVVRAREEW